MFNFISLTASDEKNSVHFESSSHKAAGETQPGATWEGKDQMITYM